MIGFRATFPGSNRPRTAARRPARRCPSPTVTLAAGLGLAADDRERDRAERGGEDRGPDRAHDLLARARSRRRREGPRRAQAAQVAVRLALVVQAGDRLLADVAALGEADGALVDARLLRDRLRRHLAPEARTALLDPDDLGGLGAHRGDAGGLEGGGKGAAAAGVAEEVDAEVGGDRAAGGAVAAAPRRSPCSGPSGGRPVREAAPGPITETERALGAGVLDLDLTADLVHREVAQDGR